MIDEAASRFDETDADIIRYSAQLTLSSGTVAAENIKRLKDVGLEDREIFDIVMVVSCFSFMNRLADGTGVTLQPDRYADALDMFGQEALDAHLRWSQWPVHPDDQDSDGESSCSSRHEAGE